MKTANLLKDIEYNEAGPAIKVMFQTDTTKEIRIVFKKEQYMVKHQTPYPITVSLVEGTLDFGVDDKVLNLVKGDMLSLNGGVPHDLLATKDCIVRLILSISDSVQRVKDVESS